jgi:hypothetical protein
MFLSHTTSLAHSVPSTGERWESSRAPSKDSDAAISDKSMLARASEQRLDLTAGVELSAYVDENNAEQEQDEAIAGDSESPLQYPQPNSGADLEVEVDVEAVEIHVAPEEPEEVPEMDRENTIEHDDRASDMDMNSDGGELLSSNNRLREAERALHSNTTVESIDGLLTSRSSTIPVIPLLTRPDHSDHEVTPKSVARLTTALFEASLLNSSLSQALPTTQGNGNEGANSALMVLATEGQSQSPRQTRDISLASVMLDTEMPEPPIPSAVPVAQSEMTSEPIEDPPPSIHCGHVGCDETFETHEQYCEHMMQIHLSKTKTASPKSSNRVRRDVSVDEVRELMRLHKENFERSSTLRGRPASPVSCQMVSFPPPDYNGSCLDWMISLSPENLEPCREYLQALGMTSVASFTQLAAMPEYTRFAFYFNACKRKHGIIHNWLWLDHYMRN